ncbi:hypothetical protein SynBIOSE41_03891 [Synechococcus sp. BIOS-E4-1]|nr:hypothetical protein SynBIOSE41_03891 [Synechococcus sp. BIOS-E4-1]
MNNQRGFSNTLITKSTRSPTIERKSAIDTKGLKRKQKATMKIS